VKKQTMKSTAKVMEPRRARGKNAPAIDRALELTLTDLGQVRGGCGCRECACRMG
jgi:hypothetical protein